MADPDAPATGADDKRPGVVDPTDALLSEPLDANEHGEQPGHPATPMGTVVAGEQLSREGGTASGNTLPSGTPPEQH